MELTHLRACAVSHRVEDAVLTTAAWLGARSVDLEDLTINDAET